MLRMDKSTTTEEKDKRVEEVLNDVFILKITLFFSFY